MHVRHVVVIGAGIGGLVAALALASSGIAVTVVERQAAPGGKMREVAVGGTRIDSGPTVLTMRHVFDEIFAAAGASLDDHLLLQPADVLARHSWGGEKKLDLFADIDRSADAIAAFAGPAEARGYRAFCARAARVFRTLEGPFIRRPQPSLAGLVSGVGAHRIADLWGISPFTTLWQALGEHFRDPRLRQLFARYATYCGSSPFAAPATLMLVAHVEQTGVWLVSGGMQRLATALAELAAARGARFRYGASVARIVAPGGRVKGVELAGGERIAAEAVVCNADFAAVGSGLFGPRPARVVAALPRGRRSLSALTWSLAARAEGFPLLRHNVFFSDDYPAEFTDIFRHGRVPRGPTVYVCAQDRAATGDAPPHETPERLFCLVNAPARGDAETLPPEEIASCQDRILDRLRGCGLNLTPEANATAVTTPSDFAGMFPATGGALYGPASHGWTASFRRPGCRTRLPGLYLAGGSIHPGPGLPMAALSGQMAAASLMADLASTSPSRATAMFGGTSTA